MRTLTFKNASLEALAVLFQTPALFAMTSFEVASYTHPHTPTHDYYISADCGVCLAMGSQVVHTHTYTHTLHTCRLR
jgi:hypothetical protein